MSLSESATSAWAMERHPTGTHLCREGSPTLLVGGQIHNSSSSTVEAITESFEHAKRFGANVVLAPVSWAQFEPVEGAFDFTLVNAMLEHAHRLRLRLVLLWFGAFKNAGSSYAPRWVRTDLSRFPRVEISPIGLQAFTYAGATKKPVLSVFSPELREADARAVEALFGHLAEADSRDVVAMVQIENETGLLSDGRDRSNLADQVWNAPVPSEILDYLTTSRSHGTPAHALWKSAGERSSGSWPDLFGTSWETEEIFMAWGFASYVEHLAARGTALKNIPVYANAWLGPQPGQNRAGEYPSGGPGARVLDIWRLIAPTLALIGPDIYIQDAHGAMRTYVHPEQPLFIPECRYSAAEFLRALGSYGAIGWSVFGVDDGNPEGQVASSLRYVTALERQILGARDTGRLAAVVLEADENEAHVELAGMRIVVRNSQVLYRQMLLDAGVQLPATVVEPEDETLSRAVIPNPGETRPFGLLIAESPDRLLVVGQGITVDVFDAHHRVEIDTATRIEVRDGFPVEGLVLNGDERLRLLPEDAVGAVRIDIVRL